MAGIQFGFRLFTQNTNTEDNLYLILKSSSYIVTLIHFIRYKKLHTDILIYFIRHAF